MAWVKEKSIEGVKEREVPSVKEIHRYRSKEDILSVIKEEMGKGIGAIRSSLALASLILT